MLLVRERGLQREFGHAHDAVHRRADFVAHVGEEVALGSIGFLGGVLGDSQFVFGSAQLGSRAFQLVIGNRQLTRAGFGRGGPFGHALFQRLVQTPQLGKAFGVLQRGTGDRGDKRGQAFFVRAEQAADLTMIHIEATRRLAAYKHRRAQRRANAREQRSLFLRLSFAEDDDVSRLDRAIRHRAAVLRFNLSRNHREVFAGIVPLELQQQTAFPAQETKRRLAHFLEDFLASQCRRDPAACIEHRIESINKGERCRLGRLGLTGPSLVEREVRTERTQSLAGSR